MRVISLYRDQANSADASDKWEHESGYRRATHPGSFLVVLSYQAARRNLCLLTRPSIAHRGIGVDGRLPRHAFWGSLRQNIEPAAAASGKHGCPIRWKLAGELFQQSICDASRIQGSGKLSSDGAELGEQPCCLCICGFDR